MTIPNTFTSGSKDIYWNLFSVMISGICGLLLFFIIGSYYGPSVLGIFNIVFAFYIILSQIAAFGVHLSVLKYLAEYAYNSDIRRTILSSGLIVAFPLAVGVSLCLWLLREFIGILMNSSGVAQGLSFAAAGLFFFALNKVLLAALNALSRLKEYAVYMALRYVFMITALLALMALGDNGENVMFVLPAAESLLFGLLCLALLKEMHWRGMAIMRQWMLEHLYFGFRGFGGNLMLDLNTRVDVLCLGLFVSDKIVGIYSMASILAEAAYQLPIVLRTVYNPRVIQMLSRRAYKPLQTLIRKTRMQVWTGMSTIAVGSTLLYPYIVPWISGKIEYAEGTVIFGVIMTGMVVGSGYAPFKQMLINAGLPGRQTFMIVLLLLINAGGNMLLIPFWGSLGAAIATGTTHIFSLVLLRYFSKKYIGIRI